MLTIVAIPVGVHLSFGTLASGGIDCIAMLVLLMMTTRHHESNQS